MSDWLDGPKFVAWLEKAADFSSSSQKPGLKRRVTDWKSGSAVSVWKADEILTNVGLHLSQIPDELWIDGKHRSPSVAHKPRPIYSRELREEVVARRQAGASPRDLEIATGIPARRIRKWTQRAKQKAEL